MVGLQSGERNLALGGGGGWSDEAGGCEPQLRFSGHPFTCNLQLFSTSLSVLLRWFHNSHTKLLINDNHTSGSTVIEHNRKDRVWAQGPDSWVERQRCGQKGDTEKARRANMYISTPSLRQIHDDSSYCSSFLNIYKNIRSKGRGVVGKEYDIKR